MAGRQGEASGAKYSKFRNSGIQEFRDYETDRMAIYQALLMVNFLIPQFLLRASCIAFGIMAFGDLEQIQ